VKDLTSGAYLVLWQKKGRAELLLFAMKLQKDDLRRMTVAQIMTIIIALVAKSTG